MNMFCCSFWEPVEDALIGTANVFVQSLAYLLDFDDEVAIVDYKVRVLSRYSPSSTYCRC